VDEVRAIPLGKVPAARRDDTPAHRARVGDVPEEQSKGLDPGRAHGRELAPHLRADAGLVVREDDPRVVETAFRKGDVRVVHADQRRRRGSGRRRGREHQQAEESGDAPHVADAIRHV
jgi:hypothetical protein